MPLLETSERVSIHYEVGGNGPPLVFIHGWAMSGNVWCFQQGFADCYQLITPDLRGHGRSSAPVSGYAFENFAHDLCELFSRMCLDQAIIIAWSMGVQVALQAFPLIRERLAALVFVSGTPKFTAGEDFPYGLPPFEARGLRLRLKKDYDTAVRDFIRGMFTEDELGQGCYNRLVSEKIFGKLPERHAAQESLKSLTCADMRSTLSRVDVPVLLIHGSSDVICLPTASHYMARHLPNACLEIINGVGHAPFLAKPAEFNEIVRKFIDGTSAHD